MTRPTDGQLSRLERYTKRGLCGVYVLPCGCQVTWSRDQRSNRLSAFEMVRRRVAEHVCARVDASQPPA